MTDESVDAPEDSPGIKYLDLREFLDGGFLQEANRQFFHPLGLALEIRGHQSCATCGDETFKSDAGNLYHVQHSAKLKHYDHQVVEEVFTPTALSGIWDYREDPEGMVFGGDYDLSKPEHRAKAMNVSEEFERHAETRRHLWGNEIQPLG